MLANIPTLSKWFYEYTRPIQGLFAHVADYQKEITFFISTFLFVYIGLLFQLGAQDYIPLIASMLITIIIFYLRKLFLPLLKNVFEESDSKGPEHIAAQYSVARGMSPIVVATLPAAFGVSAPSSFVGVLFLSIFFTNLVTTYGMYKFAKKFSKASSDKNGDASSNAHSA